MTTIHEAAEAGDVAAVNRFLSSGVHPDTTDDEGTTPLHCAVGSGAVAAVETLLQAGANPNVANGSGVTPLHSAGCFGRPDIVRTMLGSGANPNTIDGNGCSCLDAALVGLQIYVHEGPSRDIGEHGLEGFTETLCLLARYGALPRRWATCGEQRWPR